MLSPLDNFQELYDKFENEIHSHVQECERERAVNSAVNIDIDQFQNLIDSGIFCFFEILDDNNQSAGYIGCAIVPELLFDIDSRVSIEYIYIKPEYRDQGFFDKTIRSLEETFIDEGINDITIYMPNKEYSDYIMDSVGYVKTSSLYYKYIGDNS